MIAFGGKALLKAIENGALESLEELSVVDAELGHSNWACQLAALLATGKGAGLKKLSLFIWREDHFVTCQQLSTKERARP